MKIQIIKRESNLSKNFLNKTTGFTLVELIIVITILAILATIAFISFQNYTKDARDSHRMATLKNIETGLILYNTKTGKYPDPEDKVEITWTWWNILIKQWVIKWSIAQLIKLNKDVVDPKDNTNFIYSVNGNNTKYQLWTYLEENALVSYFPQTYANVDYSKRFFYTLWQKVWILVEAENNIPIQQNINLDNNSNNLKVYFSNDTDSWSYINPWMDLIEKIIENQVTSPTQTVPPEEPVIPAFSKLCTLSWQIIYTDASGIEIWRVNNTGASEVWNPENLSTNWHIVVCTWNQIWYVLKTINQGATVIWWFTETNMQNTHASYWNYYQFWKSDNSWVNATPSYTYDWKSPGGTNSWSANDWWVINPTSATWENSTSENQIKMTWPCPTNYHVPTYKEWIDIYTAWWWGSNVANFSNSLKLPLAGYRDREDGSSLFQGYEWMYWSSSPNGSTAYLFYFGFNNVNPSTANRGAGFQVRCFKN